MFRHISGIFGRKNTFFENRAQSHFRHWHFASMCQISWKNIKNSSRNSRNTVFPAKIGCSGYKNQFNWQMNHVWWWAFVFKWKKQRNTRKKSEQKLQKRRFPAYFRYFQPEKIFYQKSDSTMLWALLLCISVQNGQKTSFSGIFPAFSAGKIRFLKIGLSQILDIGILHQCAKFHEKI